MNENTGKAVQTRRRSRTGLNRRFVATIVALVVGLSALAFWASGQWFFALGLLGLGMLFFSSGFKRIPDDPDRLKFAYVSLWGRPTNETKKPGIVWIVPFVEELKLMDATAKTIEASVDAPSKDNVYLHAEFQITYYPDYGRPAEQNHIDRFILYGGHERIQTDLRRAAIQEGAVFINTHAHSISLKKTRELWEIVLASVTSHPRDEALSKLEDDDKVLDIERMGIIIDRFSVYVTDMAPEMKHARESAAREGFYAQARVIREKSFQRIVEERGKVLQGLSKEEIEERERRRREERRWDLIERGQGHVIDSSGNSPVIIDARGSGGPQKRGKKKKPEKNGDDD